MPSEGVGRFNGVGGGMGRPGGGDMGGGVFPPDFGPNGQQDPSRELLPLPSNCSMREAARILYFYDSGFKTSYTNINRVRRLRMFGRLFTVP